MKPDSELQEALDKLELMAYKHERVRQVETGVFVKQAKQSIESLFERRIAEMQEREAQWKIVSDSWTQEVAFLRAELALLRETALTDQEADALLTALSGVLCGPSVRVLPKLRRISSSSSKQR